MSWREQLRAMRVANLTGQGRKRRGYNRVSGLPDEGCFVDHLHLALIRRDGRRGSISIFAVDLDGLGLIDGRHDANARDALLAGAAARVRGAVAPTALVARSSANQLLILISEAHEPRTAARTEWQSREWAAREVADAVQAALIAPIDVSGVARLSVCVGVAILAADEDAAGHEKTAERLLSSAHKALASARSSGAGAVAVCGSEPSSERRMSMIPRLRKAIERGELRLDYQPTVDLHTGAMKGVEALARWQDEELGIVQPLEFVAVAEEAGLIEPLGAWVMDEVARQVREWEKEDMRFEIAFNLSPLQFALPELLGSVRGSLSAAGIPFERFVIEITESSLLGDFDHAVALLAEMRSHGLRIAIDDFGVGLSSLSRLPEIPADILTIDRSFVSALSSAPRAGAMIQTITQLAEKLDMRAHAEGIETDGERRFLLANGCDYGQGYFFSMPLAASKIGQRYLDSLYAGLGPLHIRPPPPEP